MKFYEICITPNSIIHSAYLYFLFISILTNERSGDNQTPSVCSRWSNLLLNFADRRPVRAGVLKMYVSQKLYKWTAAKWHEIWSEVSASRRQTSLVVRCHWLSDVTGCQMSPVVRCHRLSDVIGCQMSPVVRCHRLSDVTGFQMSPVVRCHRLSDVTACQMSLSSVSDYQESIINQLSIGILIIIIVIGTGNSNINHN